ncbi:pyridoxal phosphate-dependent aminotransferase [Paragemmobacter ruber]|uniref:histidinol-phosphate transaminase n=1 Tax=Paragemmobacter ruber TaxID=1985673 RepID=A0ABW9Y0H3_9RHOB|nr:pyridoxal phosphate-dependent aminotransferase [Rhodobacter ruber]NBE05993.1 pyridoxal phosphate-dependent aminotransferase [Rhodobacter ruber]
MTAPRLTPLAARLPDTVPFVGPEAQERQLGRAFRARLGANESRFGPSPRAVAAMAAAAAEAWMYGDPEMAELRAALAAHHGVTPAHLIVGEGIDGLLGMLVRLTAGPGDAVVTSLGAYPTFAFHVAGYGADLTRVPYRDDLEDPQALLDAARQTQARLIYLANPDNPMGTWHDGAVIEAMVDALPEGSLLVLDEAYSDLAPAQALPRLAMDDPRVIRLRTFSKGYGLAGLRVGYALAAPALIRAFDKVRNHFGMGRVAQAGAMAALADQDWLTRVRAEVATARRRIGDIAAENGLAALPSATNFVAVDCGRDGDFARAVLRGCIDRGLFIRMPGAAPLDRCIRISVGTPDDLDVLAEVLPQALAAARA